MCKTLENKVAYIGALREISTLCDHVRKTSKTIVTFLYMWDAAFSATRPAAAAGAATAGATAAATDARAGRGSDATTSGESAKRY